MTPKEEATILIDEFMSYVSSETASKHHDKNKQLSNAKECALFTVNKIIEAEKYLGCFRISNTDTPHTPKEVDLKGNARKKSYWQEVKKEIESK